LDEAVLVMGRWSLVVVVLLVFGVVMFLLVEFLLLKINLVAFIKVSLLTLLTKNALCYKVLQVRLNGALQSTVSFCFCSQAG
jgi:hypothetical protein